MHEMSVVQALVKQCEKEAKKNGAEKILEIYLKIGILSGIEVHFLQSAYEMFKFGTICEEAILHVDIQQIVVKCKECQKTSTLEKYEFICPTCKSTELEVIDGEDMMLMRLEMA